ncbi:MAG TPA: DUF2530 domain-containing protein [Candidatus Stackebrandtia faecavium]|nr:DUF2530 domain-containing protein [Candidatus Stackebrandtia faecavium]
MTPLAIGGTFLWLLAAGILSLFSQQLDTSGNLWWIHCALWGAALGIPGTFVMVLHDRKTKKRDAR